MEIPRKIAVVLRRLNITSVVDGYIVDDERWSSGRMERRARFTGWDKSGTVVCVLEKSHKADWRLIR